MPPQNLISDPVFSTTKAYAGKGTLLSRATIESLTEAKNLEELVLRLKATAYDEAVSRIEGPISSSRIERAAIEHVAKVHFDMLRISPNSKLLSAAFLRYVSLNLKTVLKGKALGKSFEDLRLHINLYPEELIGRRDLVNRALVAEGLDEAVAQLGKNEFTLAVTMAVAAYKNTKRPGVFDLYLDKAYYTNLSSVFSDLAKRKHLFGSDIAKVGKFITLDIDAHNIMSVLRAKSWDLSLSEIKSLIVQPTSGISLERLIKMASSDSVAISARALEKTIYRKILPSDGPNEALLLGSLEQAFRVLTYQTASHPFLWDAFSGGLPFALTRLKELEVMTISTVAFGVEQKMESREIQSRIIMPTK